MNTVLAERLAPLRARLEKQRAAIQPVSRIWFDLTDKTAFEQCIELSLKWMEPRAEVKLSADAWRGNNFDVTEVLGANPAKAVRIDASDGAIWAARLDWPDPKYPRTWVSEFFAERRKGALSRFGAQLTCVIRGECPDFDISRPTVVRHVLEKMSADGDGWSLMDTATKLEKTDISSLEELLYDRNRRLPIIAISEEETGACRISPNAIAREVGGAAHVFHIASEVSWELTRAIGKRMSVFNGAVRLYLPGLTEENEDPFQHPLWLMQAGDTGSLIKAIAARVLPFAFLRDSGSVDFLRFSTLRDIAARSALARRPSNTELDRARNELEVLKLSAFEMAEERDAWQSLAQEEEAKRLAADADVERLKLEIFRLEAKAAALQHSLASRPITVAIEPQPHRALTSYEDLEDWADEVLGENVYLHQAALKDCRKNGHQNMLSRIESALLVIRDYLVPLKMHGGLDRRDLVREKLGEISMEDTPCFVDRDEAKRTPGYSVSYEGETYILFDHIKFGNGYDNANQIRIYYFWDDGKKRVVVGKMPTHLRNNLTS